MAGPYPMLSRYRLLARLGSGGMAEVYLVLSEGPGGFNKLQVLKLMRSDLTDQERPDFLQMFQDEARLAARLNHPNIVQSHEVGAEDGQPFIVMEFLDGQPLNRVQQRARHLGGGFPLEMELFVLCHVLEGLDYAHSLNDYDGTPLHIVHRDVSPQNVFITYTGQTKLVDFGVAKTLESSRTRAGVVKGKVAYMPPEQVTGSAIDHRADLFSVGVLLWEAVAGQAMHADLSVYESLHRLVRGELPNIRDVAPEVPAELARILDRALKLDPKQRYADADSMRHDLLGYLDTHSKLRTRDVGEAVAKLFARERSEISQVIRRAMSDSNPGKDAADDDSRPRVTRMVPMVGAARMSSESPHTSSEPPRTPPAVEWVETPTMLESTPAALRNVQQPRKLRLYWLSALSVVVVLGVSALVALMSRSSGARNLSKPEPESTPAPVVEPAPPSMGAPEPTLAKQPAPPAVEPTPTAEPAARTRSSRTRLRASAPAPNSDRAREQDQDPYVDLPPPPKRPKVTAPALDPGDPWASDPPR
jgi:eukaryotic-like serine/threonine-protein kinase